jgi:hypothetical protein
MHKLAYGTDKLHPDESETPEAAEHGTDLGLQITRLRGEMDRLAAAGGAPPELAAIRDQLAALEPRLAATDGGAR